MASTVNGEISTNQRANNPDFQKLLNRGFKEKVAAALFGLIDSG